MKSYSNDLRERIVAGRQNGASAEELAQRFGVSKRSVERYWQRQQATGSIAPKQRGGYRRSVLEGHDEQLRQWIGAIQGGSGKSGRCGQRDGPVATCGHA